jgi:hypothetical protein
VEDKFEVRGDWWLPERADHKVPGILKFSLERGAELELFDRLRDPLDMGERTDNDQVIQVSMTEDALELSGRYPRLHGEANGKPYTLVDCFATRWSWRMPGIRGSEFINVNRILRGAIFEQGEALEATGISCGLTYLTNWIMETGIKEEWNWREDGQPLDEDIPQFRLMAYGKPDQVTTTSDGRTISLKHEAGIEGDPIHRRALTQSFHWRIDSPGELVDIDDLLDWASDLQDLISICSLKTAGFEFVRLWHPDVQHQASEDRAIPVAIDMFARWNARSEQPPARLSESDFLFMFKDFGGIEGIRRWMDTAKKHRGGLGRVAATRYQKGMFVSDRLLNCAAALEALDRDITSHANSKFKTRITHCSLLADEPFTALVGSVAEWAEAVRLDRDDVAHHFGRRTRSSSINTFYLWQSLYFLYTMCMLRLCNAPEEAFNHMQEHPEYSRLARSIQSIL